MGVATVWHSQLTSNPLTCVAGEGATQCKGQTAMHVAAEWTTSAVYNKAGLLLSTGSSFTFLLRCNKWLMYMAVCRWLWIIQPFTNGIFFPLFSTPNLIFSLVLFTYYIVCTTPLLQCNCTNVPLIKVFYSILFYSRNTSPMQREREGLAVPT